MAVDQGLCGGATVVKTGRRHRRFDVADFLLAFGDAGFENVDTRAACFGGTRDFAGVCVVAFPLFAISSATLKASRYITIRSASLKESRYILMWRGLFRLATRLMRLYRELFRLATRLVRL